MEGRLLEAYGMAMEAFSIGEVLRGWRGQWTALNLARAEAYLGREADCREHIAFAERSLLRTASGGTPSRIARSGCSRSAVARSTQPFGTWSSPGR